MSAIREHPRGIRRNGDTGPVDRRPARELERRLFRWMGEGDRAKAKVLEIGSGPIGIVSFLDWEERFAIDPLEDFYKNRGSLVALRNPSVKFLKGVGEDLPFDEGVFSLAIVDNVIDHAQSPRRILDEVHRVIKPGGLLYLAVNVHTGWGAMVHEVLAIARIDRGHPTTGVSQAPIVLPKPLLSEDPLAKST